MVTATPPTLGSDPADPAFIADPDRVLATLRREHRHPSLPRRSLRADGTAGRLHARAAAHPRITLVEEPHWKPTCVLRGLGALCVHA